MSIARIVVAASLFVLPATVAAQMQPNGADSGALAKGKDKASDPNRAICRTTEATGSRLQKKRICRTASEWAEQQAIDRQSIERSQAMRWKPD